jgi:Tfp pilus assembly protein PilW
MSDLQMQKDELLALPVSVDLATAGRAFGLGRTRSYELARAGEFPCRVIPVGRKFRVPRSALLEALGIKDNTANPEPAALCPARTLRGASPCPPSCSLSSAAAQTGCEGVSGLRRGEHDQPSA